MPTRQLSGSLTAGTDEPDDGFLPILANLRSVVKVSRGAKRGLEDLIKLLETLVSDEFRDHPAKQVTYIFENGYEQYLLENFENADARSEHIRGLAQFSKRYETTEGFLSELVLLSTERFRNHSRWSVKRSLRAAAKTSF